MIHSYSVKQHWLPTPGNIIFTVIAIAVTLVVQQLMAATNIQANVIPYQGYLTDANGNPLNGSHILTFTLYDAPTGGTLLWGPENHPNVSINKGLFDINIGGLTTGGVAVSYDNTFIEISVDGEVLSPREQVKKVGLPEISGTYQAEILVMEPNDGVSAVSVSPNTIEAEYKRIGSIVFVSLPLMIFNVTGQPRVMEFSLPFPPANSNAGASGTITCCGGETGGNLAGVMVNNKLSFRHVDGGFVSPYYRGGFWYIAADS